MNLVCVESFIDRKEKKPRPRDERYEARLREVLINGDRRMLRALFIEYGVRDAETAPVRAMEICFHKLRVRWRGCPAELMKESYWWINDNTGRKLPESVVWGQ